MGKLLIQDLKEFASIKPWNQQINLILDEFNVFANDSIINLINKTRIFNYQCFLCFQTINDLKTNNKDLTDTIFGNTANIIAHNSSSKGFIREVEEYIVHLNDLKKLKVGQAYVKILLPSSNQIEKSIQNQNIAKNSKYESNKGIYQKGVKFYIK